MLETKIFISDERLLLVSSLKLKQLVPCYVHVGFKYLFTAVLVASVW